MIYLFSMMFSKSFGYALRGVLYVALAGTEKKVQLDEMAGQLGVPRHFLGKVMKRLVKGEVLGSLKGPYGGFYITAKTMGTSLLRLTEVTGEVQEFGNCVLHFRKCDATNPCPMHHQVESLKRQWQEMLANTSIGDVFKKQEFSDFIQNIAPSQPAVV